MQLTRALPMLGGVAVVLAIACSDSSPSAPDIPRTTLGTSGQPDSGHAPVPGTPSTPTPPPPDSGKNPPPPTNPNPQPPVPDTGGVKPSTEPRAVSGTVLGMGPASDSANYVKVAGATVTWTSVDGKELARVVTGADGKFSLGSYKPGTYMFAVTPPSSSPFRGVQWAFIMSEYSPAAIDLTTTLGRK